LQPKSAFLLIPHSLFDFVTSMVRSLVCATAWASQFSGASPSEHTALLSLKGHFGEEVPNDGHGEKLQGLLSGVPQFSDLLSFQVGQEPIKIHVSSATYNPPECPALDGPAPGVETCFNNATCDYYLPQTCCREPAVTVTCIDSVWKETNSPDVTNPADCINQIHCNKDVTASGCPAFWMSGPGPIGQLCSGSPRTCEYNLAYTGDIILECRQGHWNVGFVECPDGEEFKQCDEGVQSSEFCGESSCADLFPPACTTVCIPQCQCEGKMSRRSDGKCVPRRDATCKEERQTWKAARKAARSAARKAARRAARKAARKAAGKGTAARRRIGDRRRGTGVSTVAPPAPVPAAQRRRLLSKRHEVIGRIKSKGKEVIGKIASSKGKEVIGKIASRRRI